MGDGTSVRTCALFVVSFFCPPMAVLIARGELDSYFWVNLLLTLLAWLPGVAHALWVLCTRNPLARESQGLLALRGVGAAAVHASVLASADRVKSAALLSDRCNPLLADEEVWIGYQPLTRPSN